MTTAKPLWAIMADSIEQSTLPELRRLPRSSAT
jgi:hypothetical protein